jgi:hypothetical protein
MFPEGISRYLASRAFSGRPVAGLAPSFLGAVVIPALAESRHLFETLASLAKNPSHSLMKFAVIVVVNNREDASVEEKEDNRSTLERLHAFRPASPLRLGVIDASSAGTELPSKKGGVGLARKIGFDLALPLLDYRSGDPLLISLDADTLVDDDYLPAIERHFRGASAGGAVIPFRHREGETPQLREAMERYELFLRTTLLGLTLAGSPYAFHTIGSAFACTASAYVRAGGMNTRSAAEDFYFLQHLAKTSGVSHLKGTVVRPSARISRRVPFGTGRSLLGQVERGEAVPFYPAAPFLILRDWLRIAEEGAEDDPDLLLRRAGEVSANLLEFLVERGFPEAWRKLRENNRSRENLLRAFHCRFDGFETLKLVRRLSEGAPPLHPDEEVEALFRWRGIECGKSIAERLAALRSLQG